MPLFLNPILLSGIGLIAIPIIIHLLQKNRVKDMEWAAMQFLLEIVEEQNKKIQLEDLLLLILRCLFLFFLALAVSRPVLSFNAAGMLDANGEVAILIDDSYSMGTLSGTESRFELAKKQAIKLVNGQPKGYGISVIRMDEYSSAVMGGFSTDKELVIESIKKMRPSHLNSNVENGFDFVLGLFKKKETHKSIYLISDFQEIDWGKVTEGFQKKLKTLTDSGTNLYFIPVTDSEKENLAVESVSATQVAVKVGQKATLIGVIRNFGIENSKETQIDLVVNGVLRDSKIAIVPAGQTANMIFEYVPETHGDHKVEIRVRHDKLSQDNSCYFTLKALEKLKVLAILDSPPTKNDVNDLTVMDVALNPFKLRSLDEKALYAFEYIGISDLISKDLKNYDLVLIGNVASIVGFEAKALEEYVRQGGGIIMLLGDKVKTETYNTNLYNEGKGLWSMKLKETPIENTENRILEIEGENKEHPIWQYILSEGRNLLNPVMIFKSFVFEGKPGKNAIILATARSSKEGPFPMIVDFAFEKGHFIVFASNPIGKWSQFALHPSFVAFVNQSVKYLRSFHSTEANLHVYSEFKKAVELEESQSNYKLETPSGEAYTISVLSEKGSYEIKIREDMLREQGHYTLKNDKFPDRVEVLSVNLNVREGNIVCMEKGVIENTFKPLGIIVDLTDELTTSLGKAQPVIELAIIFLILAFLCWVAENLLAYKITKRL